MCVVSQTDGLMGQASLLSDRDVCCALPERHNKTTSGLNKTDTEKKSKNSEFKMKILNAGLCDGGTNQAVLL